MSIISKMLKQVACYWGPPVPDGDGGETFPDPIEIRCRWEGVEGEARDPRDRSIILGNTIYVSQDVVVDGYLYYGALLELDSSVTTPLELDGAVKIQGFSKLPNFKATEWLRTVTV